MAIAMKSAVRIRLRRLAGGKSDRVAKSRIPEAGANRFLDDTRPVSNQISNQSTATIPHLSATSTLHSNAKNNFARLSCGRRVKCHASR